MITYKCRVCGNEVNLEKPPTLCECCNSHEFLISPSSCAVLLKNGDLKISSKEYPELHRSQLAIIEDLKSKNADLVLLTRSLEDRHKRLKWKIKKFRRRKVVYQILCIIALLGYAAIGYVLIEPNFDFLPSLNDLLSFF